MKQFFQTQEQSFLKQRLLQLIVKTASRLEISAVTKGWQLITVPPPYPLSEDGYGCDGKVLWRWHAENL